MNATCTCGAPRPQGVYTSGPLPSVSWWCTCGARWRLLSEAAMEPIDSAEPFYGVWICDDEIQSRVIVEIERQINRRSHRLAPDIWERWKGLIA